MRANFAIDLNRCSRDIANMNRRLVCGHAGYGSSRAQRPCEPWRGEGYYRGDYGYDRQNSRGLMKLPILLVGASWRFEKIVHWQVGGTPGTMLEASDHPIGKVLRSGEHGSSVTRCWRKIPSIITHYPSISMVYEIALACFSMLPILAPVP